MKLEMLENSVLLGGDLVVEWNNFEADVDDAQRRLIWRLRLLAQREKWEVAISPNAAGFMAACSRAFERRHEVR